MREIYLDNAATTPLDHRVLREMRPYFTDIFYNPASPYGVGSVLARSAINLAKRSVAEAVGCDPDGVFFTSGGTEGDNWALRGAVNSVEASRCTIITTPIEHHAIINQTWHFGEKNVMTVELGVDSEGFIAPKELESQIEWTDEADLVVVSVMAANNEIGTIEPLKEVGDVVRRAREHGRSVIFHSDAVQAIGAVPINMRELGINILTMSAHKFHGPKGVGAICFDGATVEPILFGGDQQNGMRPGTENVPGIVGLGAAIRLATLNLDDSITVMTRKRDTLLQKIRERVPEVRLNGPEGERRLPNNLSLSFPGVDSESLLMTLASMGVVAAAGSACNSVSVEPSHVLQAIRVPEEYINGTLRLTLGSNTRMEDLDEIADCVRKAYAMVRAMKAIQ